MGCFCWLFAVDRRILRCVALLIRLYTVSEMQCWGVVWALGRHAEGLVGSPVISVTHKRAADSDSENQSAFSQSYFGTCAIRRSVRLFGVTVYCSRSVVCRAEAARGTQAKSSRRQRRSDQRQLHHRTAIDLRSVRLSPVHTTHFVYV